MNQLPSAFWSLSAAEMLQQLQTAKEGLTGDEARKRLARYGSNRLKLRPQETEFEHGIRRFGYFLMEVTLVLVIAIFAINVY